MLWAEHLFCSCCLLPPSRFPGTCGRVDEGDPNQAEITTLPKHHLCFMSHYAAVLRFLLPSVWGNVSGYGKALLLGRDRPSQCVRGFVFSVDVAGFSLGSVYTDE